VTLNPLALANPKWFYDLLFASASQTLLEIAADPKHLGARIGVLAVLHTWSQTLELHPHLHCIVPGGGLSLDGQHWVSTSRPDYFLPVQVLAALFRGKLLAGVKAAQRAGQLILPESLQDPANFQALLDRLYCKTWVVYSKPPFGSPEQVLAYLARYTHRVAISNPRLVRLDGGRVTFTYKDYSQGGRVREMTLQVEEFIRRFLLHVLPESFVRIRYFGLLANRHRKQNLARCRALLTGQPVAEGASPLAAQEDWRARLMRLTGRDPTVCPVCGRGHLRRVEELPAVGCGPPGRSPP
jgi:Putative transposase